MKHSLKRQITTELITDLKKQLADHSDSIQWEQLEHDLLASIENTIHAHQKVTSRTVNILLSDLRGFTAMAEKYAPITMIELLNRYFLLLSQIIYRYGGTIDKFMGDSVMVLFGAPESADDDLERTLCCAIEMQIAMDQFNRDNAQQGMPALYMGIGINTGEVVAGTLGSELYSEYTVIGDEVNLASRVEAHCLRGQILISENTYKLASGFIEIGDVNEVHVKGKHDLVKMYELVAVSRPKRLHTPEREIRSSPRVQVEMPLAFQIVSEKAIASEWHEGQLVDISYGGLFAVVTFPLMPFSEIKIRLSLSLMGNHASDVYAKVLHVHEFKGSYECHMEFTSIDDDDHRALKRYVDQLVVQQRRE